tara:strand:+ start:683 stop:2536 length:1854 start_codon:yes stop_codon:yes gene_type:complete
MLLKFVIPYIRLKYVTVFLFLSHQFIFSQKGPSELTKYSHTEFITLLTSAKDTIFNLKDAFIYFDKKSDSTFYYENIDDYFVFSTKDTLTIDVEIELTNVHFEHRFEDSGVAFHHIKFTKPLQITDVASIVFSNCVFEEGLVISVDVPVNTFIDYFELNTDLYFNDIGINDSTIKGDAIIDIGTIETFSALFVSVTNSTFIKKPNTESSFNVNNIRSIDFYNNSFKGDGFVNFFLDKSGSTQIVSNDFGNRSTLLYQAGISSSTINVIKDNIFRKPVLLEVENFNKMDIYNWDNWETKMISYLGYSEYIISLYRQRALNDASIENLFENDSILKTYVATYKYQLESSYKNEKRLLGSFYDFYKSQYDTDFSNETYVTLKDLETKRFQYLDEKDSSFKTYFTWKINQFLKVFSAYGTEPSRSIIMSIYVIFIFAFVYLFFPNSWDTMNRNRLMKRIRFYTRYFRNKESMKEIYEEEKKVDLMTFTEFKEYMHKSQKETPSYFLLLAKPIYYFSSTNYKIISKLLDKTDILKGKWVDLPKRKKLLASFFMGLWILMLLLFDLFIKLINALTLSLNTFTTLGFGDIPTKGFPRYLSIIQGFIGWFMLSIFSVSLISQLLN